MLISDSINKVIQTIRQLGYGEISNVLIKDCDEKVEVQLSGSERRLVEFMKDNPEIDKIVVHQCAPAYVEYRLTLNGFQCSRKVKFSE